jgi:hypothetical protein
MLVKQARCVVITLKSFGKIALKWAVEKQSVQIRAKCGCVITRLSAIYAGKNRIRIRYAEAFKQIRGMYKAYKAYLEEVYGNG